MLKLFISAGHGGLSPDGIRDPGAVNGKFTEHAVATEICKEIKKQLTGKIEVVIANPQWNTILEYEQAIKSGCTHIINIHLNSSVNKEASWVEGWYYNDVSKPWTEALVKAGSKFFSSRGIKWDYGVAGQKNSTIPYAFLELGFLSNTRDLGILTNNKSDVANALVQVILKYAGVKMEIKIQTGSDAEYAIVDGKNVDMKMHPIVIRGITMIPLRFIAETLGCSVTWDPKTKQIVIKK